MLLTVLSHFYCLDKQS